MQRKLKLTLAYDGTGFHGWQQQAGVRTVQEVVQQTAQRVLRHPLEVVGASRTDAGVHARGQVAHLWTTVTVPTERLQRALGSRLPADVALVHLAEVPPQFHARRDALSKLYRYRICDGSRRPVEALAERFAWHVRWELDLERMRQGAAALVGRHDFSAFGKRGGQSGTTVREVLRIEIRRHFDSVLIDVEGGGFLYNQVRSMVGTLVEVGRRHWPPGRVAEILASADRQQAGPTAPARGLCLQWVRYPPQQEADRGT